MSTKRFDSKEALQVSGSMDDAKNHHIDLLDPIENKVFGEPCNWNAPNTPERV